MTTFSQLVDTMVLETRRPDLKVEIATYLRQTIRELHFQPDKGNTIYYRDNLRESVVTATSDTSLTWDIPDPTVFQALVAARYDTVWNGGQQTYGKEFLPGPGLSQNCYGFYRAGSTYAFKGFGGTGATISLAWFEFPRRLQYYEVGARPATYDSDLGWTYAPSFDVDDSHRLAAQNFVTNWILMRWDTVVEEGLRAKVYKRVSDTDRARTSYSMYTTLRQGLYTSEVSSFGNS